MDAVEYIKPDFPTDAFAGTATYYARYRVPYPISLMDDLTERAGIRGDGRLLDIACGPGRIAIPLAPHFREVWAIDLEPEMISVGREEAKQHGVTNIKWLIGKAEEMEAEAGSFDLITIGEAFHRLDQQFIATRGMQWLSPGRYLTTLGYDNITKGTEPWQRIVADIVRKWTASSATDSKRKVRAKPGSGPEHNQRVLQEAGFMDVKSYSFTYPYVWTIESILGNLYSQSHCSKNVLRDKVEAFEIELKRTLLAYDGNGQYHENMSCGYTLARKPL
jgi:SAM-dependent methyltransferase